MAIDLNIEPEKLTFEASPVAGHSQPNVGPYQARMFKLLPKGARVTCDESAGSRMSFEVEYRHADKQLLGQMVLWGGAFMTGLEAADVVWGGGSG